MKIYFTYALMFTTVTSASIAVADQSKIVTGSSCGSYRVNHGCWTPSSQDIQEWRSKATNNAKGQCTANVKQISAWENSYDCDGVYVDLCVWTKFECLPPTLRKDFRGDDAMQIFNNLKGLSEMTDRDGLLHKDTDVSCSYSILNSKNVWRCEMADLNHGNNISVLLDNNYTVQNPDDQVQGARALIEALPIYSIGGTKAHEIFTKTASVHCSSSASQPNTLVVFDCLIDGLIKE